MATLLVRFVYVVGMALVLGGAVLAWAIFRVSGPGRTDAGDPTTSDGDQAPFAALYELVFWVAMGAMVITGVGNLSVLGPSGPSGCRGSLLTAKLLAVTASVLGLFVQTLIVFKLRRSGPTGLGRSLLVKSYGATAAALLVLVAFAEVLAHE